MQPRVCITLYNRQHFSKVKVHNFLSCTPTNRVWDNLRKRKLVKEKCIETKFKKFSFCFILHLENKTRTSNSTNISIASSSFRLRKTSCWKKIQTADLHILQHYKMLMSLSLYIYSRTIIMTKYPYVIRKGNVILANILNLSLCHMLIV